ncbi:MAG TPA: hypothetical protein VN238_14360 [Solirubrobacteraceae bacterium]|nr:hypothetical protein [Solirubrobacteraceae bacterium]
MSTIEYVAVVLLVSIVLAVTGATVAGVDVADAVGRKVRVALCIVTGDDCDENGEEHACVVASTAKGQKDEVLALVGSGENGYVITRERLSNGRYRVRMVQRTGGAAGVDAGIDTKLLGQDVEVSLKGQAGGHFAYGQTFDVDSLAAADALVDKLRDEPHDVTRVFSGALDAFTADEHGAAEQFFEVNHTAQAAAALGALGIDPGAAALMGGYGGGLRRDHRTDDLGLYFSHDLTGSVEVSAALASAGLALGGEVEVELVLNGGLVPHALVVRGTGKANAKAQAGGLDPRGGGTAQFEARLDLTAPPLDGPARRLLGGDVSALGPLMRELPTAARVDVRFFRDDHEERSSGPNFAGIGLKTTKSTDTSQLTSAYVHRPGTGWADWDRTCVV